MDGDGGVGDVGGHGDGGDKMVEYAVDHVQVDFKTVECVVVKVLIVEYTLSVDGSVDDGEQYGGTGDVGELGGGGGCDGEEHDGGVDDGGVHDGVGR